ncbi:MAG: FMN-binding negative transcriptional regulator [Sphingomonadaceae bacterium]|nr:FMN-binding negative transcriptional regulator [Sphingomonadaceae bacterium]
MHPNPRFHWRDREAMRAFVRDIAFGALFVPTRDGPGVAHVPVVFESDETLGLHLARANRIARHLDGAIALFVVQGPHAYISPDWYGLGPDEVPTWNYLAVELEGELEALTRDELAAQIDRLAHEHERRLAPKPEWTRAKADPARIDRMLDAILGFRLTIAVWRGTIKLGQNKPEAARDAVAAALGAQGGHEIARLTREAR